MRKEIERRLQALETHDQEWVAKLQAVDYGVLSDYNDDEWEEIYFEQPFAVYRHRVTKEVRASYEDRRSDEEVLQDGGNLEFA